MPKEEEKEITEQEVVEETAAEAEPALVSNEAGKYSKDRRKNKNERRPSRRPERARQEFDSKAISIRRVTRVVAGGRRFSFSIAMVVGDRKGRVGVGVGKSGDTPLAMDKAMRDAKKNMIKLTLNSRNSINHPVEAKYSSASVSLRPSPGKGVIAGSAVRVVLELAGVKEISSKILSRSKNKLNIAKATMKALSKLRISK